LSDLKKKVMLSSLNAYLKQLNNNNMQNNMILIISDVE